MIIERYLEVVRDALQQALEMGATYAAPLAFALGVVFVMGTIAWAFGRRDWKFETARPLWAAGGGVALIFVLVVGASALRATRFLAQRDLRQRDRAQATSNPVPDAPPVTQTGPAVAALRERTYTHTLTLPPSFLNRLGTVGVTALAPYLNEPTPENVIHLRNSFRRSGRNVLFSRQVTVLDEEPLAFSDSRVSVRLRRLPGRAYDSSFEGHYTFKNSSPQPRIVHFLFSLPQAGTVRDLQVRVGGQLLSDSAALGATNAINGQADSANGAVTAADAVANAVSNAGSNVGSDENANDEADPSDPNTYEWKQKMAPGESREAVVTYAVTGARTWSYALGSERRRVEAFALDADVGGDIRFARGSLQPSSVRGSVLDWQLANVVTAQSLSLVIPSDKEGDQLFIQALTALPLCLMLFLGGVVALGVESGAPPSALRLAGALTIFMVGLGGATIQTLLLPIVMLLVAPLVGALGASALLGRRFLIVAVPVALLPATFLSAHNTGLLVLILVALTSVAAWLTTRKSGRSAARPSMSV